MRISDWSSDVCSSDLRRRHLSLAGAVRRLRRVEYAGRGSGRNRLFGEARPVARRADAGARIARCSQRDRKSVVEGKSVSVRVDIGGRRIIKKKQKENKQQRRKSP